MSNWSIALYIVILLIGGIAYRIGFLDGKRVAYKAEADARARRARADHRGR